MKIGCHFFQSCFILYDVCYILYYTIHFKSIMHYLIEWLNFVSKGFFYKMCCIFSVNLENIKFDLRNADIFLTSEIHLLQKHQIFKFLSHYHEYLKKIFSQPDCYISAWYLRLQQTFEKGCVSVSKSTLWNYSKNLEFNR